MAVALCMWDDIRGSIKCRFVDVLWLAVTCHCSAITNNLTSSKVSVWLVLCCSWQQDWIWSKFHLSLSLFPATRRVRLRSSNSALGRRQSFLLRIFQAGQKSYQISLLGNHISSLGNVATLRLGKRLERGTIHIRHRRLSGQNATCRQLQTIGEEEEEEEGEWGGGE